MPRQKRARKTDPIRAFESDPIATLKTIRGEVARALRIASKEAHVDSADAFDALHYIDDLARYAISFSEPSLSKKHRPEFVSTRTPLRYGSMDPVMIP